MSADIARIGVVERTDPGKTVMLLVESEMSLVT